MSATNPNPNMNGNLDSSAGDSPPDSESQSQSRIEVALSYAGSSALSRGDAGATLALFGELSRTPVRFRGRVREPSRLREALAALHGVVAADFRYAPRDRTAHLAYQRLRRETTGLELWEARRAYFAWLARNDPLAFVMLDPVVSVHPDQLTFEVFGKDEGSYAALGVDLDRFEPDDGEPPTWGTTNVDFGPGLLEGVLRMRDRRETRLEIGREGLGVRVAGAPGVIEKKIPVPESWFRGFLQVQSATALPATTFALAPIDLYNAIRELRLRADVKGKRRGVRVELVRGEAPRLVLEPWETVIPGTAGPYAGRKSLVTRFWGRRRLALLAGLLPMTENIEVRTLGSGLPTFWILRGRGFSFTLGLTGFTAANWASAVNFDLILPRGKADDGATRAVVEALSETWVATADDLGRAAGLKGEALRAALQAACQHGLVMHDPARGAYRARPLTDVPLPMDRLEHRGPEERLARDLVKRRNAVRVLSGNRIVGSGIELTGKVTVKEDGREYRPQLLINEEGSPIKAECTCPRHRARGLKGGPCPHLVALRIAWGEERAERERRGEIAEHESRAFSRRDRDGERVHRVALDGKRVRWARGPAGEPPRTQTLAFDSIEDARAAYLDRIERLLAEGYLDATPG